MLFGFFFFLLLLLFCFTQSLAEAKTLAPSSTCCLGFLEEHAAFVISGSLESHRSQDLEQAAVFGPGLCRCCDSSVLRERTLSVMFFICVSSFLSGNPAFPPSGSCWEMIGVNGREWPGPPQGYMRSLGAGPGCPAQPQGLLKLPEPGALPPAPTEGRCERRVSSVVLCFPGGELGLCPRGQPVLPVPASLSAQGLQSRIREASLTWSQAPPVSSDLCPRTGPRSPPLLLYEAPRRSEPPAPCRTGSLKAAP